MKNNTIKIVFLLSILVLISSCSRIPEFDHYGVFVEGKTGFIEIFGYNWRSFDNIYEDSHNFDKSYIQVKNKLIIYVYSAKVQLSEYKMFINPETDRNGDLMCANFGQGKACPEVGITVKSFKRKDDIIKITAKIHGGIFVLHDRVLSKGYIFAAATDTFGRPIKESPNMASEEARNRNRQAMLSNMQNMAAQAVTYYKTTSIHSGTGSSWDVNSVGKYIDTSFDTRSKSLKNNNGKFEFSVFGSDLIIVGTGFEIGNDHTNPVQATITVSGASGNISAKINN